MNVFNSDASVTYRGRGKQISASKLPGIIRRLGAYLPLPVFFGLFRNDPKSCAPLALSSLLDSSMLHCIKIGDSLPRIRRSFLVLPEQRRKTVVK